MLQAAGIAPSWGLGFRCRRAPELCVAGAPGRGPGAHACLRRRSRTALWYTAAVGAQQQQTLCTTLFIHQLFPVSVSCRPCSSSGNVPAWRFLLHYSSFMAGGSSFFYGGRLFGWARRAGGRCGFCVGSAWAVAEAPLARRAAIHSWTSKRVGCLLDRVRPVLHMAWLLLGWCRVQGRCLDMRPRAHA